MPYSVGDYFGRSFTRERYTLAFWVTCIGTVASIGTVVLALTADRVITFLLIISIIVVACLILLVRSYRRALLASVKDYEILQRRYDDKKFLHEAISLNYGIVKDRYAVTTQIHPDGSADAIVDQIVRAVSHPVEHIEYSYKIPTHTEDIGSRITLTEETRVPGHIVTVRSIFKQPRSNHFEIHFAPPIDVHESVQFVLARHSPVGTFTMDPEQLPANQPWEYSRQRISYPTKLLRCRLIFPSGYKAEQIQVAASYGIAGVVHRHETARLMKENCLRYEEEGESFVIKLNVEYPIHGLMYLVQWRPVKVAES